MLPENLQIKEVLKNSREKENFVIELINACKVQMAQEKKQEMPSGAEEDGRQH